MASSALNNIIVLAFSNVVSTFLYPSSLVMIKSRTEELMLTETEVTLLRAMDHNACDLSKKSNDELNQEIR